MARLSHWSARYATSRIAELIYQKRYPAHPWLTRQANQALLTLLRRADIGIEFGSGRSTLWIAQRVSHLTSVEHNEGWHTRVKQMLDQQGIRNVTYLSRSADANGSEASETPYVAVAKGLADSSLDFAFVDGAQRDLCAAAVVAKIKSGGMLIVDNVNWFLPSESVSPNSRSFVDGPLDGNWAFVYSTIANWRMIWTTSGVSDTAIFFKPCTS